MRGKNAGTKQSAPTNVKDAIASSATGGVSVLTAFIQEMEQYQGFTGS